MTDGQDGSAQDEGDAQGYGANAEPVSGTPKTPNRPPADAGEAWAMRDPDEQANRQDDPAYGSFRDAQMESFDRDYEEYQRQHPSGSRADFAAWRQQRERDSR